MSFTYETNPIADNLTRVRLLLGDTVSPGDLSDEEIDWFLQENDQVVIKAAIDASRTLAAKFANTGSDKAVGDLRISSSQKFTHYNELHEQLKRRSISQVYDGGASKADRTADRLDDDLTQPNFEVGTHDLPDTSPADLTRE